MCAAGPTDRVGIRVERGILRDIAIETDRSLLAAHVRLPPVGTEAYRTVGRDTQLREHRIASNVGHKRARFVALGAREIESRRGVGSRPAHSEAGFVQQSRRQRGREIHGQDLRQPARGAGKPNGPGA